MESYKLRSERSVLNPKLSEVKTVLFGHDQKHAALYIYLDMFPIWASVYSSSKSDAYVFFFPQWSLCILLGITLVSQKIRFKFGQTGFSLVP